MSNQRTRVGEQIGYPPKVIEQNAGKDKADEAKFRETAKKNAKAIGRTDASKRPAVKG